MKERNKGKITNLEELYNDKELYSSEDMFSPPAERKPYVIRFELTTGCDWGRCTYCAGYDGTRDYKYHEKTLDEYKEHVNEVWGRIGKGTNLAKELRRIFIGGGNALEVETEKLREAIKYTNSKFVENTGRLLKRNSIYGRTDSILNHGKHGLKRLRFNNTLESIVYFRDDEPYGMNLDLIYWGVESGSSDVLEYVNKGCDKDDIIKAAKLVRKTPIRTSVMIMPGLGGEKFYEKHIKETAEVLGKIRPRYITFMGINPPPKSAYARKMEKEMVEGKNRPLTDIEMAEQVIRIIEEMPRFKTKIGCFSSYIDKVGYNPLSFSENLTEYLFAEYGRITKRDLTKRLRWLLKNQIIAYHSDG